MERKAKLVILPKLLIKFDGEKIYVEAYVQEELKTSGITDYLWEISRKRPKDTLENWLTETAKKYNVNIEQTEIPPLENVKNLKAEKGTVYIKITKVA